MIDIGKTNQLKISKIVDFGAYLEGGAHGEILLPKRYQTESMKVDDVVEVFIYHDNEGRLIATTLKPLATVGTVALLKVKDLNEKGAFLEWGIMKDLMLPFAEIREKLDVGKQVLVYVYLDEKSQRVVCSTYLKKHINNELVRLRVGQEVDLMVEKETDLGYNVIVNNKHWGLVYKNDIFSHIAPGMRTKGYIKAIRDDRKIDVSLRKVGIEMLQDASKILWENLFENHGFLPYTDHTDPETIVKNLHMSKKSFKRAVGILLKQGVVKIGEDGIRLVK